MSTQKRRPPATAKAPPLPPCELQRRIAHYCDVKNARPLSYDEAKICQTLLHQLRPLLDSCLQNLKQEHARQKAAAVGSVLQIRKNYNEKVPTEAETATDRDNSPAETLAPLLTTRTETSAGGQNLDPQNLLDNTLPDMDEVLFGMRRVGNSIESVRGRPECEKSHSVTPQKRALSVEDDSVDRGSKKVAQDDKISPPSPSTGSTSTSTNGRGRGRRRSTSSLVRDSTQTPAAQNLTTATSRPMRSSSSKPLATGDDYFEDDEDETAPESTPTRQMSLIRVSSKSVSSPIKGNVTSSDRRCEMGWFTLLLDQLDQEIKKREIVDFVPPLEIIAMAIKDRRDDGRRRRILIDVGTGSGVNKKAKDNLDGVGKRATKMGQSSLAKISEITSVKPLVKAEENAENLSVIPIQKREADRRDELMTTPVMKSRLFRRDAAEWASEKNLNNGAASEKPEHENARPKRPSLSPTSHPTTTMDIAAFISDDYSDPLPSLTPTQPLTHPYPFSYKMHTSPTRTVTFVPCSISDASTIDELSSDPLTPPFVTEAWYDTKAATSGSLNDISTLCALSSDTPTADTLIMEGQVGTEKEEETMVDGEGAINKGRTNRGAYSDTDASRDILQPLLLAQLERSSEIGESEIRESEIGESEIGEISNQETSRTSRESSELRYTCLKHEGSVEAVACGRRGREKRWRIAVIVGREVCVWEKDGEGDEWGVLGRWMMEVVETEGQKLRAFFALNDDLLLICHQSRNFSFGNRTTFTTIDLRKPSMAEPIIVLNEIGDVDMKEGIPLVLVEIETVENDGVEEEERVAIVGSWDSGSTVSMLEIGVSGRLLATKSSLPLFAEAALSSPTTSPRLCSICTVRNKSAFVLGSFDDGSLIIWDIFTRTCLATLRPKPYTWSCVAAVAYVRQHGVALVLALVVGNANWGVVPVLVGPGSRDLASVEVLKWGVGAVGAHSAIVTSDRHMYVTTPAGEIIVCEKGSGRLVRVLRDEIEAATDAILPARRCLDVDPCDRFLVAGWDNGCVDVCEG